MIEFSVVQCGISIDLGIHPSNNTSDCIHGYYLRCNGFAIVNFKKKAITNKKDIGMKKPAFVVIISFMTSLLSVTMVIVGGIKAFISSDLITTANNRLVYATVSPTNSSAY